MEQAFADTRSTGASPGGDFDVCVIGAGAAGLTVAGRLAPTGLRIGLIESGGKDFDARTQNLSKGERSGLDYYALDHVNLRFFGGATAVWGGRCAQLNAIDFESRDWVPHSGWPFGKKALRRYYEEASDFFGLPFLADPPASPFDPEKLRTDCWQIDEAFDRFAWKRCNDLRTAPNVRILLRATATRLVTNRAGDRVDAVEIASLHGPRTRVRARAVVVCAGGIETPRLLLASRQPGWPHGLGNNSDNLGRFFMEHPHARGARVVARDPAAFFRACPRFFRLAGSRCGALYRPGEAAQRTHGWLNTGFTLAVRRHPGQRLELEKRVYNRMRHEIPPDWVGRSLWKGFRLGARGIRKTFGEWTDLRKLRRPEYGIYAILRAEQAPNPESRLTLTGRRDELGMPRIHLHWRFSELEKRSAAGAMRALDGELRRLGLGRAEPEPWLADPETPWAFDPLASNHMYGGYHHMGTARMAASERDGVCDADCRVHGVQNLFLAGSEVFPTGGWANPTLTLVALAMRLGDRIRSELGECAPSARTKDDAGRRTARRKPERSATMGGLGDG